MRTILLDAQFVLLIAYYIVVVQGDGGFRESSLGSGEDSNNSPVGIFKKRLPPTKENSNRAVSERSNVNPLNTRRHIRRKTLNLLQVDDGNANQKQHVIYSKSAHKIHVSQKTSKAPTVIKPNYVKIRESQFAWVNFRKLHPQRYSRDVSNGEMSGYHQTNQQQEVDDTNQSGDGPHARTDDGQQQLQERVVSQLSSSSLSSSSFGGESDDTNGTDSGGLGTHAAKMSDQPTFKHGPIYAGEVQASVLTIGTAADLECTNNTMAMLIRRDIFRSVEAKDLHLLDESCVGTDFNDTHFRVSSLLDQCGTLMEVRDDYIVYSNLILTDIISVSPGVNLTRDRHVEIPVDCIMKRDGMSHINFHPETSNILFREEGFGEFSFQLQLYPDDQYNSPYLQKAYPIDVHLQDRLFFEAKVSAHDGLELFINTCVATPTVNPYSSPRFTFIEEGCQKDNTLQSYSSDDPMIKRFSWEALGAVGADTPIYVHCFLMLCKSSDRTSQCALGCQHSVNKRDVSIGGVASRSKPYLMTDGPIRPIVTARHGEKERQAYNPTNILTFLVASFAFIIACLLTALAIILKNRSNKTGTMANEYEPVSTSNCHDEL